MTGTAYSEQPPSKPFKVCPEVVTAKDTPCRVLGPTAAITNRMEVPNTDKKKIKELEEKIKILELENSSLREELESKQPSKVDINKPSATRSIRG